MGERVRCPMQQRAIMNEGAKQGSDPGGVDDDARAPVVDRDRYTIEFDGQTCDLKQSPLSWRIFQQLMRRPGVAVSHEALARNAWRDQYTDAGVIAKGITILRNRLRFDRMDALANAIIPIRGEQTYVIDPSAWECREVSDG